MKFRIITQYFFGFYSNPFGTSFDNRQIQMYALGSIGCVKRHIPNLKNVSRHYKKRGIKKPISVHFTFRLGLI